MKNEQMEFRFSGMSVSTEVHGEMDRGRAGAGAGHRAGVVDATADYLLRRVKAHRARVFGPEHKYLQGSPADPAGGTDILLTDSLAEQAGLE